MTGRTGDGIAEALAAYLGARGSEDAPVPFFVQGDAVETLRLFPATSVDCVVTSPPYFGHRRYAGGGLGAEPDWRAYVAALGAVTAELLRVLKPSGSLWLNLGDTYRGKRQLGVPWRVAFHLTDAQGWTLRNSVVWHKVKGGPDTSRDRLRNVHELLFHFVLRAKGYHYDADAIREPHVTFTEKSRMRGGRNHFFRPGGTPEQGKNRGNPNLHHGRWDQAFHPKGRNKRTVWSIPLSKFREAHFAVFPEPLVETCILAGCPEDGVVLDPFLGSGTTAVVAKRLGRSYIGIDCVAEYCQMARRRLRETL